LYFSLPCHPKKEKVKKRRKTPKIKKRSQRRVEKKKRERKSKDKKGVIERNEEKCYTNIKKVKITIMIVIII